MGVIPDDECRRVAIDHAMRRLMQYMEAMRAEREKQTRYCELWKRIDEIEASMATLTGVDVHDLPYPLEVPADAIK